MGKSSKTYLFIGCISIFLGSVKLLLSYNKKQNANPIDLQLPDFKEAKKKDQKKSLLDEYDEAISGRPESFLKKTTKQGASSLAHIFQVNHTQENKKKGSTNHKKEVRKEVYKRSKKRSVESPKKELAEEPVWFFSYSNQHVDDTKQAADEQKFYLAFLDEDQKVTHGSSIMLKLREPFTVNGTVLKGGTVLYGEVKLAKNRILVNINVGKYLGKAIPIRLYCYDTDFLPGIFCEGVNPVIEKNSNKLLSHVGSMVNSNIAKAAGKAASGLLSDFGKTKSYKLYEGREVYVCAKQK